MKKWLLIMSMMIVLTSCTKKEQAPVNINVETYEMYFDGFNGCYIMLDEATDNYLIYNKKQTETRVTPCSTFKIVNSLIGLETGVIKGSDHVYKWDGKEYPIESWNADHTLASAIKNSVVWYYQRLADEVKQEQMQSYLDELDYGNLDISGGITKFWLMSSLKVSPREQVDLLQDLYQDKLPFAEENMAIVRDILVLEETDDYKLSGKTGTGESKIGWFVGAIERQGRRYFFATNIQGESGATGQKAKEITKEILKSAKLY